MASLSHWTKHFQIVRYGKLKFFFVQKHRKEWRFAILYDTLNSTWTDLPLEQKQEYKTLICAFSSLTELFAQKNEEADTPTPYVNSKMQEKVFCHCFHAKVEDVGNTSFDASLKIDCDGKEQKYLVGIKTFLIDSGPQKIAQMKAASPQWQDYSHSIVPTGLYMTNT